MPVLLVKRAQKVFCTPGSSRFLSYSRPCRNSEGFKILFMGRDEFSCLVMRELFAAKDVWQKITVATNPDEKAKHGRGVIPSPLRLLAENELNVSTHFIPQARADFKHWQPPEPFSFPDPDHLLITASFGRILPSRTLNLFTLNRRINVHPSLLPDYRGPAPIQHAILNGDKETGVCVIDMLTKKEGIDAGSIWGCRKMDVPHDATFPVMRDKLGVEGGKLLVEVLRNMIDGKTTRTPQAHAAQPRPAPLIEFEDALVDFTTMTAEFIVRRDRGIAHQRPLTIPHPHPTISSLQIHSPSVLSPTQTPKFVPKEPGMACLSKPTSSLFIRCAEGTVLSVPFLKQEGKALVDAKAWWNGAESLGLVDGKKVDLSLRE